MQVSKFECKSCSFEGEIKDLEVVIETDHEVWEVFRCPVCCEETGRTLKNFDGPNVRRY